MSAGHEQTIALMQQGRWQEAEAGLREAVADNSSDATAIRLLGTLCHVTGRAGEACALLQRAVDADPDNPAGWLNLGSVHLDAGRVADAEHCFTRVAGLEPGSADGPFNLGLAAQRDGRLEDAGAHYREALSRDAGAVDAAVNLAALDLHQGRLEDCVKRASRALDREPGHLKAQLLRLKGLMRLGRIGEAERALAAWSAQAQTSPELLAVSGELHYRAGRHGEAATAYRAAQAAGDAGLETALNLARCLLESGDPLAAAAVMEDAVARHPEVAECHALRGIALMDAGAPERAVQSLQQASALSPRDTEYATLEARALFESGRTGEADRLLESTIAGAPGAISPTLLRVEQLAARGELEHALAACDGYLQGTGPECNLLAEKGFLLHALGRHDDGDHLMDYEHLLQSWIIDVPGGFQSLRAFNRALAAHIRAHPSLTREGAASRATQGGRQSGNLFFGEQGPFQVFEQILWQAADRYRANLPRDPRHPFLATRPPLDAVYGWAVVLERAGYQSPHIHPTAWLSGVYYVELPSVMDDGASQDGWIEFGAPPPEFSFETAAPTHRLRPEPGRIALFPSYFYHRTLPYRSDEQRISVAFDFSPRSRRTPDN